MQNWFISRFLFLDDFGLRKNVVYLELELDGLELRIFKQKLIIVANSYKIIKGFEFYYGLSFLIPN